MGPIEEAFIKILPQLPVPTVTIVGLIYFLRKSQKMSNEQNESFQKLLMEREKQHQDHIFEIQKLQTSERRQFVDYVNEHNHTFTELVRESTKEITITSDILREVRNSIECSNKTMCEHTQVLKKVADILSESQNKQ